MFERLFRSRTDCLIDILREQLAAKDRQILQLQSQVDKVLGYQFDRPNITPAQIPDQPSLPVDTFSDVNSPDDDADFVEQMQNAVHGATNA